MSDDDVKYFINSFLLKKVNNSERPKKVFDDTFKEKKMTEKNIFFIFLKKTFSDFSNEK